MSIDKEIADLQKRIVELEAEKESKENNLRLL